MSRVRTPTVLYVHMDGCQQVGCPGHDFCLEINFTTDSISIMLDGKVYLAMPDDLFKKAIGEYQKWKEGQE